MNIKYFAPGFSLFFYSAVPKVVPVVPALDFYERALPNVTDPEVQALFTELRDEEAEHVDMVQKLIAALPPGTEVDQEKDEEEFPAM
ncbi:MAG: hypothetical protein CMQ20_02790 [Gammaproteobacteria bacterium]|jgi:rubrerythrin|nr:hypothetical protein [Gammaproteobacteria bacterium]|tara:strand:- start:616 stop:876 length:261 start_codon:yes stop_codon:yes gene_type:complete